MLDWEKMEAAASSSSSLSALLRHRLRATVRRCFGNGERMRWARRAGAGEFRYDALSYALNFDGGDLADVDGGEEARRRGSLPVPDILVAAHAGAA